MTVHGIEVHEDASQPRVRGSVWAHVASAHENAMSQGGRLLAIYLHPYDAARLLMEAP